MKDLLEAITIICKYCQDSHPTNCQEGILRFNTLSFSDINDEDANRLFELGFIEDTNIGGLMSLKFGSN